MIIFLCTGQLKVGDQLLQANTESLVGVSNERYITFNETDHVIIVCGI